MQYEYRITKHDDKILTQMGKESRQLIQILGDKMYWSKQVKKTIVKTEGDKNEQWIEFRDKYKDIKNSGLSNNTLIVKYNKLCKEGLHSMIMENLEQYKIYLEARKKKEFALMAQTYINQERFRDNWDVVEDMSRKWIDDLFKQRGLNSDVISNVLTEVDARETKNKPKEITNGVVNNIIDYVISNHG